MSLSQLDYAKMRSMGRFAYCSLKEAVDAYQDLKRAELFLSLIRQYFPTTEHKRFYKTLLTRQQWNDFRRLVTTVKTGTVTSEFVYTDTQDSKITASQKMKQSEKQIGRMLIRNKQPLLAALDINKLVNMNLEFDYREFGRADAVVIGDRICYPIEIKDETATERVVGQIQKYIKGAICVMKNGWYDWVQGVVIAPGFTQVALNTLRQEQIYPLQIEHTESQYKLKNITACIDAQPTV